MGATGKPLAHLRFPVNASRGRRFPEPPHPFRNPFQRDRDRVIHSRSFRRLENKTQVFTSALSDHFRNRLTHTLEVSQIARTVAQALGLNEDLTEALALAHDLGHPPFGHAGEMELDRVMQRFGERFEHNRHALRIVESFEQRYARHPGLNLTFEVREGILKHSRDLDPAQDAGYEDYLPGHRPPLEAQLIDTCDEIAYNTADLEDAYVAGLLHPGDLERDLPVFAALSEQVRRAYPEANEKLRLMEITRSIINVLVEGLLEGTVQAAGEVESHEAVRTHPARLVRLSGAAAEFNRTLKAFLRKHVYDSRALEDERIRLTRKLPELFDFYLEHPDRMPEAYRREAEGQPLHWQICDYIAGMTDRFFLRTHQQVCG
ncbi:MAG: dNTP triphosphohydrolase [Bryobacteraceae bacterium]|nr:dNTP triphosphohydrolase [Bryobacteraceae bacterium]